MVNAKRSNGVPYTSRAVRLDPEYMTYKTIPNIDVDERLRDLRANANKPEQNKAEVRAKEYGTTKDQAVKMLEEAVKNGKLPKAYLEAKIKELGLSVRNVEDAFSVLEVERGYKSVVNPFESNKVYFGKGEDMDAYAAEIAKMKADAEAAKASAKAKGPGRPKKVKESGKSKKKTTKKK